MNSQGKITVNKCQSQDRIIKDIKVTIISMLHKVRENTFDINERIQILNREMENRKRNQLKITELRNTISEVKKMDELNISTEMIKGQCT